MQKIMGSFENEGGDGPGGAEHRTSEIGDDGGSLPVRQIIRYPSVDKVDYLFSSKENNMEASVVPPHVALLRPKAEGSSVVPPHVALLRPKPDEGTSVAPPHASLLRPKPERSRKDFQPQSPLRTESFGVPKIPSVKDSGFENLPWDKIAIGVVLLDDEDECVASSKSSVSETKTSNVPRQAQDHTLNNSTGLQDNTKKVPYYASSNQQFNDFSDPVQSPSKPVNGSNKPEIMIEVGPGVSMLLRGSDETWKAIEDGRVTITSCIYCQIELNCLDDAQLVICPVCTMMSPVDQTDGNDENSSATRRGVGVGIKPEDVVEWVKRRM